MNKRLFYSFIILVITVVALIISLTLLQNRSSFFGVASQLNSNDQLSRDNSYIFASPLVAKASANEKVRVTVFILNSRGLGISGTEIELKTDPGITIEQVKNVTDNYGKAIFDISAINPGEYLVEAMVNNSSLPQKVTVSFK